MTTTNKLVFDPFLKECASFLYQYNQLQEEMNQPEINEQVISNCETKIKACQYILEIAKNKINGVNGKYTPTNQNQEIRQHLLEQSSQILKNLDQTLREQIDVIDENEINKYISQILEDIDIWDDKYLKMKKYINKSPQRSPGRQILKNSKTPRLSQQLKFSQGLMQQDQKNYTPKNKYNIQNSIQENFDHKTNENTKNYSSQDNDDEQQFISLDKTDKKKLRQYPEQVQVSSYAEYNSKLKENPYNFSPNTLNVKKLNIENSSSKIPSTMPSQNFQDSFDSSTIKQHSQLKINFNKFELNNISEIQDQKTDNKFQKQKTPKNLNFEDSLQNSEIKNPSFQHNQNGQKDYNLQSANNFEKNPKIEFSYKFNKTYSNSNYQNANTNKEDTQISNNSKNENDNSYQDLSLSQNQSESQQNKKFNDSQNSSEKISKCKENNNQNKISYIQDQSKQTQEKLTIDKNENINNDKQEISQNQISFKDYINIKTEEDTKEFLEKLNKSSEKKDIKYEYKNLQKYNVDSYNAQKYNESNYSTKSYNKNKYKINGELEVSTASYANYSKGEYQQYNDQPATYNNSSLKFDDNSFKLGENQKSEQQLFQDENNEFYKSCRQQKTIKTNQNEQTQNHQTQYMSEKNNNMNDNQHKLKNSQEIQEQSKEQKTQERDDQLQANQIINLTCSQNQSINDLSYLKNRENQKQKNEQQQKIDMQQYEYQIQQNDDQQILQEDQQLIVQEQIEQQNQTQQQILNEQQEKDQILQQNQNQNQELKQQIYSQQSLCQQQRIYSQQEDTKNQQLQNDEQNQQYIAQKEILNSGQKILITNEKQQQNQDILDKNQAQQNQEQKQESQILQNQGNKSNDNDKKKEYYKKQNQIIDISNEKIDSKNQEPFKDEQNLQTDKKGQEKQNQEISENNFITNIQSQDSQQTEYLGNLNEKLDTSPKKQSTFDEIQKELPKLEDRKKSSGSSTQKALMFGTFVGLGICTWKYGWYKNEGVKNIINKLKKSE